MSSIRRIRRRMCGHKVPHATEQAARFAIRELRKGGALGHLRPYRCRFCGSWHIGNVAWAGLSLERT